MRIKSCLIEHQLTHLAQVLDGAAIALAPKPASRLWIALLGSFSQDKKSFSTACPLARAGHFQHLLGSHEDSLGLLRSFSEGAIGADIPAELGEGDKDLWGEADDPTLGAVPNPGGFRTHLFQVLGAIQVNSWLHGHLGWNSGTVPSFLSKGLYCATETSHKPERGAF